MANIKAIETTYKGFRFRSRLEARWAVFFNEMKIKWRYELEGYVLPNGECYLPDFFLPQAERGGIYVEVKPNKDIPFNDLNKAVEFALAGNFDLLLLVDVPGQDEMYLINRRTSDPLSTFVGLQESGHNPVEQWFAAMYDSARVMFNASPFHTKWQMVFCEVVSGASRRLHSAKEKAKSARFEFGEGG